MDLFLGSEQLVLHQWETEFYFPEYNPLLSQIHLNCLEEYAEFDENVFRRYPYKRKPSG